MNSTTDTTSTELARRREELERRRDSLAFDFRHDPDLREPLAEVEAEISRLDAETERESAAERERVRRKDEEATRVREMARVVQEQHLADVCQRSVVNAAKIRKACDVLFPALREEFDLAGARSAAAQAVGKPGPAYALEGLVVRYVATGLTKTSTRPLDFSRPTKFDDDPLDETMRMAFGLRGTHITRKGDTS